MSTASGTGVPSARLGTGAQRLRRVGLALLLLAPLAATLYTALTHASS